MSKLLQFKDWLTIGEASNYLTMVFNELVKPTDLYRLAIENKLVLSLYFVNNTYIELATKESNNAFVFNNNYQLINDNSYCDLVTIDNSNLILKQHYYNNSDIPLRPDNNNKGIIFYLPDNLTYGRLINYTVNNRQLLQATIASCLPNDIYLIIRTDYLLNFVEQATQAEQPQTELHNKERLTLYQLIKILGTYAKLPLNQSYKTADLIREKIAPETGCNPPSREAIAKHLKAVINLQS
ncbi:hypothetical protein [Entomomonas asaccharolytica]|uniref:Uncharacterized protein n=1 Tax=Entomomonas asaccharolytica TaxID=2785331 RepID=A0A974NFI7_9GAMM|nr:hypothetical protein [Entomomonas asaccharolytica]QQP85472.1 hypothetical protein JHT90_14030 [Entomomonas asaccharolytica]